MTSRECILPKTKFGTWVAVVGPDGSGKSTFADELVKLLEARGDRVAHTHGRPQVIARRHPPADADPSDPHARGPRNPLLSFAKYLLAVVDFLIARRRLLRDHDVWISERPLLDYEVDPNRYQLSRRVLGLVRRLNNVLALPDTVVLLTGNAHVMAERKGELTAGEIDRQLSEWRRTERRVPVRFHTIDTTTGRSAADAAVEAAATIERAPPRLNWRVAPIKPTRLDVRVAGNDTASLDVYRPIRFVARSADALGRLLVMTQMTRRTETPDPAVDELVAALQQEGSRITGVAAMASSAPRRWVIGLAHDGHLAHVVKLGPDNDPGIPRETANLRQLNATGGLGSVATPQVHGIDVNIDRAVLMTGAHEGRLEPLTDLAGALDIAAELALSDWTHGDFAPWNAFRDERGRLHLVDWEEAEQPVRPLWDMVHFLLRLGATTNPQEARVALTGLTGAAPAFERLLAASGVEPEPIAVAPHVDSYLASTHDAVMSPVEGKLRSWLAQQSDVSTRSNR